MSFRALTTVFAAFILSVSAFASTKCSIQTVIVKGQVDNPPSNAVVRVQLVFAKQIPGESAEATIEDGIINIPVEFSTQRRGPIVNGLFAKCDRKPETVVISLIEEDPARDFDRVSLSFARDFKMVDASAYGLRSELVLNRPR